jgi:hypothetical protein
LDTATVTASSSRPSTHMRNVGAKIAFRLLVMLRSILDTLTVR